MADTASDPAWHLSTYPPHGLQLYVPPVAKKSKNAAAAAAEPPAKKSKNAPAAEQMTWDVETRLEILLAFCHGFSHFGILAPQPTAGPSLWLSAQNLQFCQNHVELFNLAIITVVLSKFDSICELQPEFRP